MSRFSLRNRGRLTSRSAFMVGVGHVTSGIEPAFRTISKTSLEPVRGGLT